MQKFLETKGNIQLFVAVSAEEGIQLARQLNPELILLDIHLPNMDGFEACKQLRKDVATKHIPIAALSANAMPGQKEYALKMGFEAYLTKPLKFVELDCLMRSHLGEE